MGRAFATAGVAAAGASGGSLSVAYVFDPFQRGEHHAVRNSLGLGLYIVKQIAAAHGGSVEARSNRESGTTFVVRLPYAAPGAQASDLAC